MRFGVCIDPERCEDAAAAGADYIECSLVGLNQKTDTELNELSRLFKSAPMLLFSIHDKLGFKYALG